MAETRVHHINVGLPQCGNVTILIGEGGERAGRAVLPLDRGTAWE